jgi:hypothetical protein
VSRDIYSNRPLLDKLGVKPGTKVALAGVDDAWFVSDLRTRTHDITHGKPTEPCDLVFLRVVTQADLGRIKAVKSWIEPSGGIWVLRVKGPGAPIKDTDVIEATLAAGLVDNKIASFSDTESAMRLVFRLRDR